MLIAHVVPGYFAVHLSKPYWNTRWNVQQQYGLWIVAISSNIMPDIDVIYNIVWRGFAGHSILWTHSLIPYLVLALIWYVLYRLGRWPFLQMLVVLTAVGGLSHVLLDVIAHGTPLLYPFSLTMFGNPPQRVVEGGIWIYLTDPIFLIEPLLVGIATTHGIIHYSSTKQIRVLGLIILYICLEIFVIGYIYFLPLLQENAIILSQ